MGVESGPAAIALENAEGRGGQWGAPGRWCEIAGGFEDRRH